MTNEKKQLVKLVTVLFGGLFGAYLYKVYNDAQHREDGENGQTANNQNNQNIKTFKEMPISLIHFDIEEFDSPDVPGSGGSMRISTLQMLDRARDIAGVPFRINSGFRTPTHNKKVGGVSNSAHLRGYAVDIHVTNATRERILAALKQAGFNRFGLGATFIHADNDPSLKANTTWTY